MQTPHVIEALKACSAKGLSTEIETTSFYLGRERLVQTNKRGMLGWRKRIFRFLSRNAKAPSDFFRIPAERVVELGLQVEF